VLSLGLMLVVLGSAAIICVLRLLSLGLMTAYKIGEDVAFTVEMSNIYNTDRKGRGH
jgi:hypothetical protein